ncbi:MAG: hypothetical protein DBX66_08290 [Clostridiales bacterium]|nr:MAG: hypothetical protein DBX66_08290 [Clostridiales bacterium]
MDIILDQQKIMELLNNFTALIDVKFTLLDLQFNELLVTKAKHPFCAYIQSHPIGYQKCYDSDKSAFEKVTACRDQFVYRCHAGLIEACFPVIERDTVISYLMFGQILDNTSIQKQWDEVKERCSWYPGIESLEDHFFHLKQFDLHEIEACASIVSACTAYVWLSELVRSKEPNYAQRIRAYIDTHYHQPITLDDISAEIKLGKTMLCQIARSQLGDTVNKLIAKKRIEAAKAYLETTNYPISQIAELVGISDYNYFTKIFKSHTSMTPTQYKKQLQLK